MLMRVTEKLPVRAGPDYVHLTSMRATVASVVKAVPALLMRE
jgi:hypothetical protein